MEGTGLVHVDKAVFSGISQVGTCTKYSRFSFSGIIKSKNKNLMQLVSPFSATTENI